MLHTLAAGPFTLNHRSTSMPFKLSLHVGPEVQSLPLFTLEKEPDFFHLGIGPWFTLALARGGDTRRHVLRLPFVGEWVWEGAPGSGPLFESWAEMKARGCLA
jgi:hypothetical protein